jgi:hypothetical protein
MLIGVDFDNTIVCYDEVFRKAAMSHRLLSADGISPKRALHDFLHQSGQVDRWTALQGEVYGPLMKEATPFPGVLEFFRRCRQSAIPVRIISHRTRYPYLGQQHDLHQAAQDWLAAHGFYSEGIGLRAGEVFFEVSRKDKLSRIASEACTHFIDDLAEVLSEPDFPRDVRKILFDPHRDECDVAIAVRAESWDGIERLF